MFDRRLIMNFDWALLITAMIIAVIGIGNIYSSTYPATGKATPYYVKQIYWLLIGIGVLALALWIDYRTILRYAHPFYILGIILLLMVFLFGRTTSGSQRWLSLYFFSFQPSEMMKIGLILALTKYFSEHENPQKHTLREIGRPLLMIAIPVLFVLKQPDLGTVGLLVIIFFSILAYVGLQRNTWVALGILWAALVPLAWHFLKDYQKNRLLSLPDITSANPKSPWARDPFGAKAF